MDRHGGFPDDQGLKLFQLRRTREGGDPPAATLAELSSRSEREHETLDQFLASLFGSQEPRDARAETVAAPVMTTDTTAAEHSRSSAIERAPQPSPSLPDPGEVGRSSEQSTWQDMDLGFQRDPAPEVAPPKVPKPVPPPVAAAATTASPAEPATPRWKYALQFGSAVAGVGAVVWSALTIHRRFTENSRAIAGVQREVRELRDFVHGDPNSGVDVQERIGQVDRNLEDLFAKIDSRHRRT